VRRSLRAARALALATTVTAATAGAQERLLDPRLGEARVAYERWSFGGDGALEQAGSPDSIRITSVSQLSVPVTAVVPWGERWTFDLYGAYAQGVVRAAPRAGRTGDGRATLSGLTDIKLRAVGRLAGDAVLITLGANVPTGRTSLDVDEFRALRVLAAPALALRTPALGTGPGGTAGVVVARQLGAWAGAAGLSYELRGSYSPLAAIAAGVGSTTWNPGDALHLSLGADRLLGNHELSLNVSGDFFTRDRARIESTGGEGTSFGFRLGPVITAQGQLRVAAARFRELDAYALTRYRSSFRNGEGERVAGSSGSEVELGVAGVAGRRSSWGLLLGADVRVHSGLSADNSLATAAARVAGLTVGAARDVGRMSVRPAVRAQLGTVNTGGQRASASAIGLTLSAGTHF